MFHVLESQVRVFAFSVINLSITESTPENFAQFPKADT